MSVGQLAELAAWILSAVIAVWMAQDMFRVSRRYDEDFLTTSTEELDEARLLDDGQ